MRIVAAIGGNALLKRGDSPDADVQLRHLRQAALALVPLAADELIIVHGNGPQVGLLAMESETDASLSRPYPLDVLVAQTQGMIGYWLAQELTNVGSPRPFAGLLTRTVVDRNDPGFAHPTKFIGSSYPADAVPDFVTAQHWTMASDGGRLRRVVPSPAPVRIPELDTIELLLKHGRNVICAGGGGSPVVEGEDGRAYGVEAVVDKDLVAAHLAIELGADRLLLLTDVEGLYRNFGSSHQQLIRHVTSARLPALQLPAGSMGPKAEAAGLFAALTGRPAAIGALDRAEAVWHGASGTRVTATRTALELGSA